MRDFHFLAVLALLMAVVFPYGVAADNGVDDLRGRWDVDWTFADSGDQPPPLLLFINEMRATTLSATTYYAGGCMRSPDTDALMPLSVRAYFDAQSNSYDVVVYSTVVPLPEYGEPYVIRLTGNVQVNGEAVQDDAAAGTFSVDFGSGEWTADHHDRRQTKCPSIADSGLGFRGDLYAHRDLAFATPRTWSLFEGHTVIVSSGMLVEAPDGSSFVVQEYTDIFSPDVDFVGRFRYLLQTPGFPIQGGTYRFSLVDIFGDPIPGTESTDVWYACDQDAPRNLGAAYAVGDHVDLSWDAVPVVAGEFDPGNDPQIGYYQIGIWPFNGEGAGDYGSAGIASTWHAVPWNPFDPGTPGTPDGGDFGVGLSELSDGLYGVGLFAFSQPDPTTAGFDHECMTFDSTEFLTMAKQGSDLSFQQVASISGHVTDEEGAALAGVQVAACEYDWQDGDFCAAEASDDTGLYEIVVPAGGYRVQVNGQAGWANEFFDNTPNWNLAAEVSALEGQETPNINFALTPAGSISGTVRDAEGNPLANIAVDTEVGGYGTCTDENGNYVLQGVPFGTLNVVAGRDFCGAHSYLEQMVAATISAAAPDAIGVDFTLEPGGTISGVVYDEHGQPMPDVAVDVLDGGYGTCTDENGRYTLGLLPFGSYDVAGGRDFCGPHPYEEEVVWAVVVDSATSNVDGVDFYLGP